MRIAHTLFIRHHDFDGISKVRPEHANKWGAQSRRAAEKTAAPPNDSLEIPVWFDVYFGGTDGKAV